MKVTYLPGQIEEMHQLFNPLCSPYHQLISQGIYFHQHLYSWPIGATTADGVQVKRRATQKAKNINNIQFQRHSFPWFMAFLCKSTDSIQQMVVTTNSAAVLLHVSVSHFTPLQFHNAPRAAMMMLRCSESETKAFPFQFWHPFSI